MCFIRTRMTRYRQESHRSRVAKELQVMSRPKNAKDLLPCTFAIQTIGFLATLIEAGPEHP